MGLGSNLGDRPAMLAAAREGLARLSGVRLAAASPVYETEPQGLKDQPWFANQVLRLEVDPTWTPEKLLDALLALEKDLGRSRDGQRWGPRAIDLDLLAYGDMVMATKRLTLPHPHLRQRAFVLVPLRDVAPGFRFSDGSGLDDALDVLPHRVEGHRIYQAHDT